MDIINAILGFLIKFIEHVITTMIAFCRLYCQQG